MVETDRQEGVEIMETDPVTGLTPSEEKDLDNKVKVIMRENSITTMYEPYYMSFAKTIQRKTTAEAQIDLNKWNARGLNKAILIEIARRVNNKVLV